MTIGYVRFDEGAFDFFVFVDDDGGNQRKCQAYKQPYINKFGYGG